MWEYISVMPVWRTENTFLSFKKLFWKISSGSYRGEPLSSPSIVGGPAQLWGPWSTPQVDLSPRAALTDISLLGAATSELECRHWSFERHWWAVFRGPTWVCWVLLDTLTAVWLLLPTTTFPTAFKDTRLPNCISACASTEPYCDTLPGSLKHKHSNLRQLSSVSLCQKCSGK